MYALANTLTPDLLNAVAAQVFVELLKSGYTSVCEFHYLHGIADGPLIASQALIDAANAAGIAMTLLPTLYQRADFTAREPAPLQRKFFLTTDAFLRLVEQLQASVQLPQNRIGIAFHSLRAVGPDALQSVMHSSLEGAPIHIHVAEQLLEVQNCKKHLGTTPIHWLLDNVAVDRRWCLVHATHASSDEMAAIAKSEAIVCLCPTTEANLGDGFFDAKAFLGAGGRFAIGADSNVSINAAEELRWLEYQRRLQRLERNVLHAHAQQSGGTFLWDHAARTGADASGRESGVLEVGARADIVVLDLNLPIYAARREDELLDTFIFCAGNEAVRDVMVGGRWLVQERKHFAETAIASGYRRAIAKIRDSIG
jgi:formimidoylglutamate deiminase